LKDAWYLGGGEHIAGIVQAQQLEPTSRIQMLPSEVAMERRAAHRRDCGSREALVSKAGEPTLGGHPQRSLLIDVQGEHHDAGKACGSWYWRRTAAEIRVEPGRRAYPHAPIGRAADRAPRDSGGR
jgi:hypothetical protein